MSVNIALITQLLAIALVEPAVVLPGIAIFLVGTWLGNIYMQAQLPVKREMSNKKAPVLGHFGAAVAGLSMCSTLFPRLRHNNSYSVYSRIWSTRCIPSRVIQAH